MVLTEEKKQDILSSFRAIFTTKQEIKDLNKSNSDLVKRIADNLGVKSKVVNSAYRHWSKRQENDDSEDVAFEIIESL